MSWITTSDGEWDENRRAAQEVGRYYRLLTCVPPDPGRSATRLWCDVDRTTRVRLVSAGITGKERGREIAARVVGDGPERAASATLTEGLGVTGRVRFRGFVTEERLLAAYARAAVFCMPGVAELRSLATLEAMASGTPVVAADAMALPHLVRPGRNGWLYQPGDVPGLAMRLRTLLADPSLRARMGAAGRTIAAEHAVGATLDTFEAVYRSVLGLRARPHPRAASRRAAA